MGGENLGNICIAKACGWNAFSKTIGCSSGDGSCLIAEFVPADESDFHTAELVKATEAIRDVLSGIKPKKDRKLAFVNTPFGILLAWVEHDISVPQGSVNIKSSDDDIAKALGISKHRSRHSHRSGESKTY